MFKKMLCFLLFSLSLWAKTPNDTLIIAQENESQRLNPAFSEDHDATIAMIFSGLTRFDENERLVGDLAQNWSVSKDGLEYVFSLKDAFWHDGVKVSADDVKFSLEAYMDAKNSSTLQPNFADIKSIEIIDVKNIKITLKRPFPAFLDALSEGIIPKHILQNENLSTSEFNQKPIGTGPYKLVEWKKGQYFKLVANENYHLTKVKTPNLIIKIINDPNLALVQLKSDKIDAALIDNSLIKNFKNDNKFQIIPFKSADYRALMFNLENEFLKEKNIRLALNHAINKEEILKNILHNQGFVAHHPLQISWANDESFKDNLSYDPIKAENLLKESGFERNKKGVFQRNGKELSFELYAMSNDPLRVLLVGVLQSELSKFGVKTSIVAKPAGSFDYSMVDSFLVGWGSPFDPDFHTYRVFASSQDSAKNPAGWNFGHYSDEKVDKALARARNSLDINERKKAYSDFIKALSENPPFIFLAYLDFSLVTNADIKGIKTRVLGHHGVGFTHNIYEWYK